MIKISKILGSIVLSTQFLSCNGQLNKNSDVINCNRSVYGSASYIASLPKYVCIPDNFVIDDYVRTSDLDGDGQDDFLAVKFNKKEDNQVDGDSTYWRFYIRSGEDTTYFLYKTLPNLVPLYLKKIDEEYLLTHPSAARIAEEYPRRLNGHDLSFQLYSDTIKLSYKFDDTYGKSFVFVNDQKDWYLVDVEYFIGELPMYWWKDNEFYYPLRDKIKIIERRKPKLPILIEDFDLRIAFKYREEEWMHLTDWHLDRIDKTKWSSIEEVEFSRCQGIDLPEDWTY